MKAYQLDMLYFNCEHSSVKLAQLRDNNVVHALARKKVTKDEAKLFVSPSGTRTRTNGQHNSNPHSGNPALQHSGCQLPPLPEHVEQCEAKVLFFSIFSVIVNVCSCR